MGKFIDLVGKTFGELTVIEMLRNYNNTKRTYCKCIGIDGNEYIIRQDALRSGATKYIKGACKAGKPYDITGLKFHQLTAIYPTNKRETNDCIIWHCECDCGKEIDVSASNLIRGHVKSCGCRKRSIREKLIVNILDKKGIEYMSEKTFDGCQNPDGTMNLYFDFYLPHYNAIIEYDGESHFEPIKFFGGDKRFTYIQECDSIKNLYCKDHGIRMIRIPYTKTEEEIMQIINEIIQSVTITVA